MLVASKGTFGGPIALSLSGGGGRAVGFHLGTFSYLDHLGIMQEVTILSSVSGGTFLAAGYAFSLKDEKTFQEFYEEMYEFLAGNLVLGSVMSELATDKLPPSGRRNLVTAIANVYDKYYFRGRKFGDLWEGPDIHLGDIIFNATEFKTGIAFRFQRSGHKCRIGNGKVWLEEKHAKLMRMADVMAASSCIPGGLEPLIFPRDFHWPGDDGGEAVVAEVTRSLTERFGVRSIALMDGGVYDNQGISSVLLAINRQKKHLEDEQLIGEHPELVPGDMTLTGRLVPGQGPVPVTRDLVETEEQQEDRLLKRESTVGKLRGQHLLELIHGQTRVTAVDLGFREREIPDDHDEPETPAHELLGLFIISDTPVRKDPVYDVPQSGASGFLTLGHIEIIGWVLLLVSLLSVVAVSLDFWTEIRQPDTSWSFFDAVREIFSLFIPIVLTGAVAGVLLWIRAKMKALLDAIPETESTMPRRAPGATAATAETDGERKPATGPWRYLRRLTVHQFSEMVGVRIGSMYAVANEVFMNRIRDLGYALVHSQPDLEDKIISNEIFTLLDTKDSRELPVWLAPTAQMEKVVIHEAANMGTKLWWSPMDPERRNELDVMVAAGQITTCYNLLAHMWLRYKRESRALPSTVQAHGKRGRFVDARIEQIFTKAEEDWELLREDSYAFVDKRRAATQERKAVKASKETETTSGWISAARRSG